MNANTYQEAKAQRDAITARLDRASQALAKYPKEGALQLTPDHVRALPAWQAEKRECQAAFKALQDFNIVFTKRFAVEIRAERDAKRAWLSLAT